MGRIDEISRYEPQLTQLQQLQPISEFASVRVSAAPSPERCPRLARQSV